MDSIIHYTYFKTGNYNLGGKLPVCLFFFQTTTTVCFGSSEVSGAITQAPECSPEAVMGTTWLQSPLSLTLPLQITETQPSISFTNYDRRSDRKHLKGFVVVVLFNGGGELENY